MDCREVEELAGAFALRALPEAEATEMGAHLASCAEAHALIAELLDVVDVLPLSLDEQEPPGDLRDRLLTAALAEGGAAELLAFPGGRGAAERPAATPSAGESTEPGVIRSGDGSRRAWWRSAGMLAAAALLVVSVGLGVWATSLQRRLNSRDADHRVEQQVLAAVAAGDRVVPIAGSDLKAFLVQPPAGGQAYVVGAMPAVPSGKAYEAWLIRDGKPVQAGVFKPGGGYSVMPLEGDLQGASAVAVTVEPDKGSEAPTTQPVARFSLG